MMSVAGAPRMFWAEASVTAVYLQNRTVTNATGVTPFERWKGWKPSVRHLRIFGCKAYALKPDREKSKFSGKADQCIFLGYEENVKGYRLLEPNKHKILIRRDVKFDEANFPWKKNKDRLDFDEAVMQIPSQFQETEKNWEPPVPLYLFSKRKHVKKSCL